jgi:hypothetical protein
MSLHLAAKSRDIGEIYGSSKSLANRGKDWNAPTSHAKPKLDG